MIFCAWASPMPGKLISWVFDAEFRSTSSLWLVLLFSDRLEFFEPALLLPRPQPTTNSATLSSIKGAKDFRMDRENGGTRSLQGPNSNWARGIVC